MSESRSALAVALLALILAACSPGPLPTKTGLDDEPARMVSAFLGLDNGLQSVRWKGHDGMPVTFSSRVEDPGSVDPEAFTVITRSGARMHPLHVTTRPIH